MMNEATLKFIISRIIDNANDSLKEAETNKDNAFNQGHRLAYYEVLDTIKNELEVNDQDLKEFGLDIDLDKIFL